MKTTKLHYVYRITNTQINKHYYGSRSCEVHPSEDLGKSYFSSSRDNFFLTDQLENPQNYKYKIVRIFTESRKEATNLEVELHEKFQVDKNPNFYNIAKQTSGDFSREGLVTIFDTELGISKTVSVEDFYENEKYEVFMKNKVVAKSLSTGKTVQVTKEEFDSNSDLVGHTIGKCSAFDKEIGRMVQVTSEELASNPNLAGNRKGMINVKDVTTGKQLTTSVEEFEKNPNYVSLFKDTKTVIVKSTGETKLISVEEFRKNRKLYKTLTDGKVTVLDKRDNSTKQVSKEEFDACDYFVSPNAKKIGIFNNVGELVETFQGDFDSHCKIMGYPKTAFRNSLRRNGEPLYQGMRECSLSRLRNNDNIKFQGWQVREIS